MKNRGFLFIIGLLSVLVLVSACTNNRTARNIRDDDGILDNGNDMIDNDWGYDYNDDYGYNANDDLDLTPDGINAREENIRRGITTQVPTRTLPNPLNGTDMNNRITNTRNNTNNTNVNNRNNVNTRTTTNTTRGNTMNQNNR